MTKPRSILKDYFKKGKIPRESDFADLIDSMVNQEDDKLTIESGTGKAVFKGPLKVESSEASSFAGNLNLGAGTNITFADNGSIRSLNEAHSIIFHRKEAGNKEAGNDVNKLELREWGSIVFSPGATERKETAKMVIRDNGNVGIGTEEPKAKLDVNGDLRVSGSQNIITTKVIHKAVKNKSGDTFATWEVDYSGEFSSIYAAFVVFQGFSLWDNNDRLEFDKKEHANSNDCIPQHAFVRLEKYDKNKATGVCYCSESKVEFESDNTILFALVVLGRP